MGIGRLKFTVTKEQFAIVREDDKGMLSYTATRKYWIVVC